MSPDQSSAPPASGQPGPGPALLRATTFACRIGTAAGALLLAAAFYRFGLHWSASAGGWYATAITVIAITLWLPSAPPGLRVGAIVSAFLVLFTLLGIELVLETLNRREVLGLRQAVEQRTGVRYDVRYIPEVVHDLQAKGVTAVPSIVPKTLLGFVNQRVSPESRFRAPFLPMGGVANRTTVQLCVEGGQYPIYQSDEHGFLNPPGNWSPSPDQVILIGDSYTHGYCVPEDSTIAAALRAHWPHVLSLGTGGSGPLVELATLSEYAGPLHPKMVLWLYSENDFRDLAREQQNPTLMQYLQPGFCQGLDSLQPAIDRSLTEWIDRVYATNSAPRAEGEFNWRNTVTLTLIRGALFPEPDLDRDALPMPELPLFTRSLAAADARVRSWGGRLVFVFLPDWARFFAVNSVQNDSTRPAALAAARELGIPILDLLPVFTAQPDQASLFSRWSISRGHFSGKGYAVAASAIATSLAGLHDSLAGQPASAAGAPHRCGIPAGAPLSH
ncbi:MAG: hypothetical protein ABI765_07480 [Gemmatimonadota bacterium]